MVWVAWTACTGACLGDVGGQSTTGPDTIEIDLIDHTLWEGVVTAQTDPFASMGRPEVVECDEFFGWTAQNFLAGRALDIDLYNCNWLALEQPLDRDLAAGTPMRLTLYHYDLTSPEPAEAYMALAVGGEVLWEKSVVIPGDNEQGENEAAPADVHDVEFQLEHALSQGEQVVIHVHNHGENSYVFEQLRATVSPD